MKPKSFPELGEDIGLAFYEFLFPRPIDIEISKDTAYFFGSLCLGIANLLIESRVTDLAVEDKRIRELVNRLSVLQELFKTIKKYSLQQKKSSCNVETLTMERSVNKKSIDR